MTRRLPIRARIAGVAALVGLLASAIVSVVAIQRFRDEAYQELDVFLSQEAAEALALVSRGGRFSSLVDVTSAAGPSQRVALFDVDGTLLDSTTLTPPLPDPSSTGSRFETTSGPDPFRLVVVPFVSDEGPRTLVVASALAYVKSEVLRAGESVVPLALLATMAVAVFGYLMAGLALRPVERLRSSAAALAALPAGRRLDVPGTGDELQALATTLNEAIDAVDRTVTGQRQFVAEASHELRTPIARLRAELDFARRPTRTPEEVNSSLEVIDHEVDGLSQLAEGLLDLLANQHPATAPLESVPGPVIVDDLRALFSGRSQLSVEAGPVVAEVVVRCRKHEILGAVRNLVDNAEFHGRPPVLLRIDFDAGDLVLAVEDHGAGIEPELLERIELPFVKGSGPGGRAGLGLAIVHGVAERHGGVVEITNLPDGCRVTLRIPAD